MLKNGALVAMGLLTLVFIAACRGGSAPPPQTAEDCILRNMRGVTSDVAAREIKRACNAQFAPAAPVVVDLPKDNRKALRGAAAIDDGGDFSGTLYNGNPDWNVSQVTLRVWVPEDNAKSETKQTEGSSKFFDFNVDVNLAPLTTKPFAVHVGGPAKQVRFAIVHARGTQITTSD